MRTMCFFVLMAALPLAAGTALDSVKQEPDPVKRFQRALALADSTMQSASELIRAGGSKAELEASLNEIADASALALRSLRDTGKKPAKMAKEYKKGELATRSLLKRLGDMALAVGFEERGAVEKTRDQVTITHEEFLLGVMSGK
jgi:hypothetical protein